MTTGKPTAAIMTLDPANQGGIRAMMTSIYQLMIGWGFDTELVYTLIDPPLPGQSNLRGWRGQHVTRLEMPGFAMPSLPLPFWLWTMTPVLYGRSTMRRYDAIMSVVGSAHIALLPAMLKQPFVMWVATVYEDELRSKAASGDRWSQRLLNGPMWGLVKAQERLVLRRATRILALSPYTAQRIREIEPAASDNIEIMFFPIDTDFYHPDESVRTNSPYGDYLLFTARINDPRKNVPMLLRAFAAVHQQFPDLKLVLAGEMPDSTIQSLVDEFGLTDAVIFPGLIAPGSDELRKLYQGARLFTLSSKQEGLGIVVLEALACGTPVISTRCGGPEGIIIEGETGRLVPNDDADAFAQAIIDVLSQPDLQTRMQHNAAAYALEHFALSKVEQQLFAAMQRVFPEQTARLSNPPSVTA